VLSPGSELLDVFCDVLTCSDELLHFSELLDATRELLDCFAELLDPSAGSGILEELDNFTELLEATRELLDIFCELLELSAGLVTLEELDTLTELLDFSRLLLEDDIFSSCSEELDTYSAKSFVSSDVPASLSVSPQPTTNNIAKAQKTVFLNVFIIALLNVLGKREKL
jgi:hypothetical protein